MQSALGQWQVERREFARELDRRARYRSEREAAAARAAADATEDRALPRPGKVVEVGKGQGTRGGRYGKVIELAPPDDTLRSALDDEISQAAARAEAAQRRKREDPEGFARDKAQREALVQGNRDFEAAVARRWKQREAEIEAEARAMQAELDAARLREERAQAKKLGGTVDEKGNFVDSDLKAEETR